MSAYETEPTNNKATRTSPSNADEWAHGTFPPWMTRRQCVPHRHRRTVSFRHSLSPRFRLGRETDSIFFRSINVRRRSRLDNDDNNTPPIHVLRANSATKQTRAGTSTPRRTNAPDLFRALSANNLQRDLPCKVFNVGRHAKLYRFAFAFAVVFFCFAFLLLLLPVLLRAAGG